MLFAFLVMRWNRGVLPVAAALAIILAIFAGIAAPAWFDRAKDGLSNPALPPDLLGMLCLILVPVQVILIAVAMVAFNQDWHVEEERPIGDEIPPGNEPDEDDPRSRPVAASRGAPRRSGLEKPQRRLDQVRDRPAGRRSPRRRPRSRPDRRWGPADSASSSGVASGSIQSSSASRSRITGIRSWIGATTSLGSQVTIAQE